VFRFEVDDVFSIRGRGTVVTGQVIEGTARVGDEVLINGTIESRIDGIEAFRKILEEAGPGTNLGLLLRDLDRGRVSQGDIVTSADAQPEPTAPDAQPEPTTPDAPITPEPTAPDTQPEPTAPDAPITPDTTARTEAPTAAEGPAPTEAPASQFASVANQRQQFLQMRTAGLMSDEQIDDSLRQLAFTFAGRQWLLKAGSDRWLSSTDGRDWKHDTPPA
jgi:hypothetical protein